MNYSERDLAHYDYEVGREGYKVDKDLLVWNVFHLNPNNNGKVEVYNIFKHTSFMNSVIDLRKECKSFDKFAEGVRRNLSYYFGSKCEWEIEFTGHSQTISLDEIKEYQKEIKERNKEYKKLGGMNYTYYKLESETIDVYLQVMLNWDRFITFVWGNRALKLVAESENEQSKSK